MHVIFEKECCHAAQIHKPAIQEQALPADPVYVVHCNYMGLAEGPADLEECLGPLLSTAEGGAPEVVAQGPSQLLK